MSENKPGKIKDKMAPEFMNKLTELVGVKCGVHDPRVPSRVPRKVTAPTPSVQPPSVPTPSVPLPPPPVNPAIPNVPFPQTNAMPNTGMSPPYTCVQQTFPQQSVDYTQLQMFMMTQQQMLMQQQMMMQQHHQQTMALLLRHSEPSTRSAPEALPPPPSVTMHTQQTPTFMIQKKEKD